MQPGRGPELWLQLLGRHPLLLLLVLVLFLIRIASPLVMEIGVGVRWKRSPNHRRPQTMTMHPCPAVEVGGRVPGSSLTDFASPCWGM